MRFLTMASLFVLSIFAAQLVRYPGLRRPRRRGGGAAQARGGPDHPRACGAPVLASDGTALASSVVREVVVADQQAVCTFGTRRNEVRHRPLGRGGPAGPAALLAPLLNTTAAELVPQLDGHEPLPHPQPRRHTVDVEHDRGARHPRHLPRPPGDPVPAHLSAGHDDRGPRRLRPLANGEPGGGVELMMQEQLRGTPGRGDVRAGGVTAPSSPRARAPVEPAVDGQDVTLTINSSLQWYAQNALAQRVKEIKAASGTVVIEVARPVTCCAWPLPTFDANTGAASRSPTGRTSPSDVFEPGSTSRS